jgi:hypothetical protein
MTGIERLVEARGTGEIVEIVYRGGNQPGTRREINVHDVVDGYLEARCLATGLPKTFRLDLVEVWNGDPSVPAYNAGKGRAAASARGAARKAKRGAKTASDRMIAGMSNGPVPPLIAPIREAPDKLKSARMIEGMSRVRPVAEDVDTGWIARDAIRVVEQGPARGEEPAAGRAPEATRPSLWQRLRRALGGRE